MYLCLSYKKENGTIVYHDYKLEKNNDIKIENKDRHYPIIPTFTGYIRESMIDGEKERNKCLPTYYF